MKLKFMKLFFSCFLAIYISAHTLFSKDVLQEYSIKTKGVTIGALVWGLSIAENKYQTSIELKNKGVLSIFYQFSGSYAATGTIKKNSFFPTKYVQS